jgi:uncharacterized repeat protein (TIGR01451 family)
MFAVSSRQSRSMRVRRSRTLVSAVLLALTGSFFVMAAAPPAAHADDSPFAVTMTPSADPVSSGSQLTYTIDVKNAGGDITQDTVLNSQISGMTGLILTSNVGTCSQTDNQVTCQAGIMAGQQSWRVTIRGTVTAPNGSTLFNGVTVTGNHESSGYETSVYSSVLVSNTSSSPKPDLSVSIQGPATIPDEGNVVYQLTVNNAGSSNAVNVTVIDTLPDGTSFASVTANSLFACVPLAPRTVQCTGGRVNAGANATISITAAVADPDDGNQMKNTAVVDPYDFIDESNELNNTGSLVSVNGPQPAQTGLTIVKTGSPDVLRPGDQITYTLVVTNMGATRADNIATTDITQGLDAASITATTTKGVCTVTAPKVTCTQKSPTLRLNPGESLSITIKGTVTSPAGTLITNLGTTTGEIKNKSTTNTSRTTTTVKPGVDLSIVQKAATNHLDADDTPSDTDPFRAWDHFEYDISLGNSGLDDAQQVLVREVVAPGVKFLDDDRADVPCDQPDGIGTPIVCTVPLIQGANSSGAPYGTFQFLTLHVVSPPATGTIAATVTVDPANAIFEADETNNTWSVSTPVVTGIDLTVTKSSESPIAPSGTLTYTILVSNIGTQDATGVTIKDTLPAGTRFRSVQDDPADPHNFTCSHDGSATGGDVTCVGGRLRGTHDHNLMPDVATVTLVVFAPAQPGFIRNQVRVDPANEIPELLEDNNINTFQTEIKIQGGLHPFHEFDITKTQVSPAGAVAPNGIVLYDLVVTNHGSDVAFGVKVQDIMPAGFTFRYAVDDNPGTGDFQCDQAGGIVTCDGGTLDGTQNQTAQAGDSTRTIHVSMFSAGQPGSYTNKALVDPDNTDPEADETNNSAQAVTTVAVGGGGRYKDLQIDSRQTAPADDVVPSGTLQYTLDVTNSGTAVAFNVKARDTLPDGAVFRSAVDSAPGAGAFECSASGLVVTCTGGTLDGSAGPDETTSPSTRSIVIEAFAPTEPGDYVNTAMVDPDDAIAENDELNNVDTTVTKVRLSGGGNFRDLVVDSITTPVAVGTSGKPEPMPKQEYTYEVKVKNTGTNPAYNVVTRHVLEDGATFVSATGGNDFTCSIANNVLACDGGVLDGSSDLDPTYDNTATFTITVRAPARDEYTYSLISRVDPANAIPEANEANNSKSLAVEVVSQVDLTIDITSVQGGQGSAGSVEFSVKAAGAAGATEVYAEIELPVGVIPQDVSLVHPGWSCQIEENPINKVTCHGDLDPGEEAKFKVDTYVTATSTTANAYVDPDDKVVESEEGNNTDTQS